VGWVPDRQSDRFLHTGGKKITETLDRHPEAENVWIVGGGSGHGFKHGPVVGEMVSDAVLALKEPPTEFKFERLLKNRS